MTVGYEDLVYELRDHVGVITLARPEVHNALRRRTYTELEDAVRTTDARVLVITGRDPSFCSSLSRAMRSVTASRTEAV